jgi:hypothetical protein
MIHRALTPGDDREITWGEIIRQEIADLFGMMMGLRELSGPITGRDYEGPAGTRYIATLAIGGMNYAIRGG